MITSASADPRAPALAAGAWIGCALGWVLSAPLVTLLAVVPAAMTAALVARGRRVRGGPAVVLAAVGVAAGGVVAGLGASAREPPQQLVDRVAEWTFVVGGEPRQLAGAPDRPARLMLPGTLTGARLGARQWRLELPAAVIGTVDELRDPRVRSPGATVRWFAELAPTEPTDTRSFATAAGTPVLVRPPTGWAAVAGAIRERLREALAAIPWGDPDAVALVAGLTLGDESLQSPDLAAAMQQSGLSHLTAVSGGNLSIVAAVVLLLVRARGVGIRGQVGACAGALAVYVAVVGPQPSVVRAAALAAAGLLGVLRGGPARGFGVLAGCVGLLLLLAPELAWSLGFALSVAATAGLQVIAPPLHRLLRRTLPDAVALAVAVALAAQLATWPVLVVSVGASSWLGVPANLLAAVLVAPITVLGLLTTAMAVLPGPVAVLTAIPADLAARALVAIARAARAADEQWWSGPLVVVVLSVTAVAVAVPVAMRRWPRGWPFPVAAVVLAVILVAAHLTGVRPGRGVPADWRMVVCDVGQGAAVVLRGQAATVLVDTGPSDGDVTGCLRTAGVRGLTAVVLSHPHADHIGGLPEVLAAVPVAGLIESPATVAAPGERLVQRAAQEHHVPVTALASGASWSWGDVGITVLGPRAGVRVSGDDLNDGSLVLSIRWADGASALLPGDIEPLAQGQLMASWSSPHADVVVIPHHGSDHQDPRFGAWSGARVAIASAGADNDYGHPAAATLAEYQRAGAQLHRTDTDGSLALAWRDGALLVQPVG